MTNETTTIPARLLKDKPKGTPGRRKSVPTTAEAAQDHYIKPVTEGTGLSTELANLVKLFLSGYGAGSLKAYSSDLRQFRTWYGDAYPNTGDGLRAFLAATSVTVPLTLAMEWQAHSKRRAMASSSINRRMSALRALADLGRKLGLFTWALEVNSIRHLTYRDTRGPDIEDVQRLFDSVDYSTAGGARDYAILRTLFDVGGRRTELHYLRLKDYQAPPAPWTAADALKPGAPFGKLNLLGKGQRERTWYDVPPTVVDAIERWLVFRGREPGALFVSLSRSTFGQPLSSHGIYNAVVACGDAIGLEISPHKLRHSAITQAAKLTGGNMPAVLSFARHANPATTMRYIDNNLRHQGNTAAQVGGSTLRTIGKTSGGGA